MYLYIWAYFVFTNTPLRIPYSENTEPITAHSHEPKHYTANPIVSAMYHPNILVILLGNLIFLPLSHEQDNCYGNKSIVGYCTPLTYTDTTDNFSAPPGTSDCEATCAGINQDAGDWLVDFSTDADDALHSMLLYHCGFAVSRGEGTPPDARFSLTNQDILDLYDESLNRFGGSHDGGLSAAGTMQCGDFEIKWYIQDLYA